MLFAEPEQREDGRSDESVSNDDERAASQAPKRTHMTRQKAGQRGGLTTAKRHGREFYERIGRKGGQSRKKADRDGVGV